MARKMVIEMLAADQPDGDEVRDKPSHMWEMTDLNGRFPKMDQGIFRCWTTGTSR